jgi:hypothetical protein
MQPVSEKYPLRLRLNACGIDLRIEPDRDLQLAVTRSGINPEVRFYLKSEEPVITMSNIDGHNLEVLGGCWVDVRAWGSGK